MDANELIELLDRLKSGLISQATNGSMDNREYQSIRKILINEPSLKKCDLKFIKSNLTSDEFRRYMQGKFEHYSERRNYITENINSLINYLEEQTVNIDYVKTGWEKIDDSVEQLFADLNSISDNIDINQIGVRCRETIIELSNIVYKDELHHPSDYKGEISNSDSKKKIDGYIEHNFKGQSNEEKRSYAKSCNKLADYLTHGKRLTQLDARLGIIATISLIQLIKTIEKYNK